MYGKNTMINAKLKALVLRNGKMVKIFIRHFSMFLERPKGFTVTVQFTHAVTHSRTDGGSTAEHRRQPI